MEQQSGYKGINVIVYAENESNARQLISKILSNKVETSDIWSDKINGHNVYGYIRWPGCSPKASPQGVTDIILIWSTGSKSESWEALKNYIDARKGIPFKFLTNDKDVSSDAKSIDCDFISLNEVSESKEKLVKSALDLEETLRNAFKKIDSNGNGFLSSDEILKASNELGHPLNAEDAREIGKSLSTNGQISFEKFKEWWILGKSDFNSFRKIVEIDLVVNNLIKRTSETFNTYLDQIQKEGSLHQNSEAGLSSNVHIVPTEDFVPGTAINFHLNAGNEFNGIINSLPSYFNENPASFGLELKLKDPSSGKLVIETFEGVKEMLTQIPQVQQIFELGAGVSFRHVGSSVFIDIYYGGIIAEKINSQISMFNFSTLNFSGSSDLHLCSKLSPFDLLTDDGGKLIEALSQLKIEGKGEYNQLKTVFNFIINTLTTMFNGNVPKEIQAASIALKFASVIRKLDFTFKYDSSVVRELIIHSINHAIPFHATDEFKTRYEKKSSEWSTLIQPDLNGNVQQFSQMGAMFLEAYKDAVLAIDLDNIALFVVCPVLRIHSKLNLQVRGITEFVSNIFQ